MRHQPLQLGRARPCRPRADGPRDFLRRGARAQPPHAAVDLQMIRTTGERNVRQRNVAERMNHGSQAEFA